MLYEVITEYFEVQPSDVEVLMVSGNVDFSTPPQYATEELLPQLSNAQQVILEDFGHTESIWFSQPEAHAPRRRQPADRERRRRRPRAGVPRGFARLEVV